MVGRVPLGDGLGKIGDRGDTGDTGDNRTGFGGEPSEGGVLVVEVVIPGSLCLSGRLTSSLGPDVPVNISLRLL